MPEDTQYSDGGDGRHVPWAAYTDTPSVLVASASGESILVDPGDLGGGGVSEQGAILHLEFTDLTEPGDFTIPALEGDPDSLTGAVPAWAAIDTDPTKLVLDGGTYLVLANVQFTGDNGDETGTLVSDILRGAGGTTNNFRQYLTISGTALVAGGGADATPFLVSIPAGNALKNKIRFNVDVQDLVGTGTFSGETYITRIG